jgi:two-component system cell cycle response regulator DivK
MAHLFDTSRVPHLLDAAERLLRDASTYERQLTALVASMDNAGTGERAMPWTAAGVENVSGRVLEPDALESVRELSAAAHEHCQRVAALVTQLIGQTNKGPVCRALVVDDGQDNRELAAAALEASGFEVIGAANGLDGVIAAHYARPSIILMDITMPILDGLEATRLLKASDATRAINVIAYTAQPSFYQKAFASLFVAVLGKPADPQQMIAVARRFASA